MPTLLAIDDDPMILHIFRKSFPEPDTTTLTASSAEEGLRLFAECRPDVVVLDVNLPGLSGLETFDRLRQVDARTPVIFITADEATGTAIEAMKRGAYDYVLKPLAVSQLQPLLAGAFAVSRLMQTPAVLADEPVMVVPADVLVGSCPAMQDVCKAIGRVAPQDVTVLVLGESGTGKELVARAIYQHSRRAAGPFLAINCAALPETLLESELFGHEKGAFTGAERKRVGKFEQCSGGTLFLDEVGDMAPLTQTKILRVLQDQRFERVGGNETIQTNVRLIAATNRDLEGAVGAGQFRGDLYYRLSVFTIHLPPLRQRADDLPQLVGHFLRRFSRELGKTVRQVAPETLELFRRYTWPGNLRELQSALKQAILRSTGPVLVPDFLPASLRGGGKAPAAAPAGAPDWDLLIRQRLEAGTENLYAESLSLMERHLLTRVLRHTAGNQVRAAQILGITRKSLRAKIGSLGISIKGSVWASGDQPGS